MIITKSRQELESILTSAKASGKKIGFVPTMGALHNGHLSLVKAASEQTDITVVSIFVNPTQFNDPSDFEKYPKTIETDIAQLLTVSCNVLFLPEVGEMYPNGTQNLESYDLGFVETVLDGAARPGHFQGVAQVVSRLLDAVQPHLLFLGQKDYQQCMVIDKLIELKNIETKLVIVPTMREPDGLAMSSRNKRLSDAQRALSNLLYQCLVSIEAQQEIKTFNIVQKECIALLEHKGFKPDYVALADAQTLEMLNEYDSNRPMVALIAAFIGDVRLIDNLPLKK